MADEALIAFCTFPDEATARKTATQIVEAHVAACANILPRVHSIYRWQDKLEANDEVLAVFKLAASRYPEFESKLRSLHPYDVPEIIGCKIDNGLPDYLRWVAESCAT